MSNKDIKNIEMQAYAQKREVNDLEYRALKVKQYLAGSTQDTSVIDSVTSLAPAGMTYASVSILNQNGQHNSTDIYRLKKKGYREVPPDRHPELDMNNIAKSDARIQCATYQDFYLFEIETFVLEERDKYEFAENKKREEIIRRGYETPNPAGMKNDWDRTSVASKTTTLGDIEREEEILRRSLNN